MHNFRQAISTLRLQNHIAHTTPFKNVFGKRIRRYSGNQISSLASGDGDIDDTGIYEVILPPDPPIWGTSHISPRSVPISIPRPPYVRHGVYPSSTAREGIDPWHGDPYYGDGLIELGGEHEKRLRRACTLAKRVLEKAEEIVRVGITTNEIDAILHNFIIANHAYPSPLHYAGFPKSCCTSVNNIVVHGIPDDRKLIDGDIINIDITVYLDGFHGDTSRTFLVGGVDLIGRQLTQLASDAVDVGVSVCGPGVSFKAIGAAIQDFVESRNISISQQFTGHGIGSVFHRPPWILHHRNDEPGKMQTGHCFTIEPALIFGADPSVWIFPDGWTSSTVNGCRSAQAEHTVLITETGVDILTA